MIGGKAMSFDIWYDEYPKYKSKDYGYETYKYET